jgi:hypothetical protein
MSMTIQFDTLRYVEKLRSAGMPEAQAKASAEALSTALDQSISNSIATQEDFRGLKADINELRVATKAEINELRVATNAGHNKLQSSVDLLRSDFKSDIKVMQWMLGTIVVGVVSLVAKSFF